MVVQHCQIAAELKRQGEKNVPDQKSALEVYIRMLRLVEPLI